MNIHLEGLSGYKQRLLFTLSRLPQQWVLSAAGHIKPLHKKYSFTFEIWWWVCYKFSSFSFTAYAGISVPFTSLSSRKIMNVKGEEGKIKRLK